MTDERFARVNSDREKLKVVQDYLPNNYRAVQDEHGILIRGHDSHGWTLDGYVIPRLGSGLIFAREVSSADCIADGDIITLWDCKCSECFQLQREWYEDNPDCVPPWSETNS